MSITIPFVKGYCDEETGCDCRDPYEGEACETGGPDCLYDENPCNGNGWCSLT